MNRRLLPSLNLHTIPTLNPGVLVLGSGIAGLAAALAAAESCDVLLVAKSDLRETNTYYAQGGIAAAIHEPTSEKHVADTIVAGAGLCDEAMVRILAAEGVQRVRELVSGGVPFDREGSELAYTLEGGHSERRILHADGDATGRKIEETMLAKVAAHPRIETLPHHFAFDLLHRDNRCHGALLLDTKYGRFLRVDAGAVIVATGGLGRIYRETTNPDVATGDGMALCFRAGAMLRDMEFVQFHPTTLYLAGAPRFLISEAVRGEGAKLITLSGERFMAKFHPKEELAPRDVVSQAIIKTMIETETSHVLLDLRHLPRERIEKRFPTILGFCADYGIDISKTPIPVRPAAHYMMGGVATDANGQTAVDCLYAAGEAACTGVHGANRLASNSLLEGLVFGHRAGQHAASRLHGRQELFPGYEPRKEHAARAVPLDIDDVVRSLKALAWRNLGIFRSSDRLTEARENIEFWSRYVLSEELRARAGLEAQNMLTVAMVIARAALMRTESRGAHQRLDYPAVDSSWQRHIDITVADFEQQ